MSEDVQRRLAALEALVRGPIMAVHLEREACAKVVDDMRADWRRQGASQDKLDALLVAAMRIRNRG